MQQHSGLRKLRYSLNVYDFMSWNMLVISISIFLLFTSFLVIITRGFNWGMDFTGGIVVELCLEKSVDLSQIRNILTNIGYKEAMVQSLGSNLNIIIRIPVINNGLIYQITDQILLTLNKSLDQNIYTQRVDFIGPGVGNDLMKCAGISFVLSLICIFVYVNIRFRWYFAVGAVLALVHDVVVIVGVLSLLFIEINAIIISALMFIFCYSLNDSIVIFDRIRENCCLYYGKDVVEIFNISLTQVLKRTFITSFTTAIVLLILLIFGGSLLHGLVTTLLVGVFVGTFSSIYVASALAFQLSKNNNVYYLKNEK